MSNDIIIRIGACNVHRRVEERPETQVVRATSFESHISSVGRSVVDEAVMATRVHEHDLEVRESEAARGSFLETTEARGGAWHGFR